jgi:hypothetical protein
MDDITVGFFLGVVAVSSIWIWSFIISLMGDIFFRKTQKDEPEDQSAIFNSTHQRDEK